MRLRFGDYVLDRERRELSRSGQPLHLTPKAFDLLTHLGERRPATVSQEQLFDFLWPETLVDTSRIHQLIQEIREAVGDEDRRIIRTVYGRGYSFDAAAIALDEGEAAMWQIIAGPVSYRLQQGENIVGRDLRAEVRIDSPSVSRRHARIVVEGDRVNVEDLESRNGTQVRGRRIHNRTEVDHGAEIVFGAVVVTLMAIAPPPPTQPLPIASK